MAKLAVFNFITLNGFFKGPGGDVSWHQHEEEGNEHSAKMLAEENILIFGRITYEMMAGFWPTPMALETNPVVAKGMNKAEKIVFSTTLAEPAWENTSVVKDDLKEKIEQLKKGKKDLAVLGSGTLITQLAGYGLIDEYQFMIDPVIIPHGVSLCDGLQHQLQLELTDIKRFKSGTVLISYKPV